MNGTDSKYFINYFKKRSGKYLKLENGKKVKLFAVVECQWTLTLSFTYDNEVLVIPFTGLYEDCVTMHIPKGLEQGYFVSSVVKFDNLQRIGYAIENILTNWTERKTERKDEVIELDWEE